MLDKIQRFGKSLFKVIAKIYVVFFYCYILICVVSPPNCFLVLVRAPCPGELAPGGATDLGAGGGPHVASEGEEKDNLLELLRVGVAHHLA